MLDELAVTNLGVIASARLEPGPGLVVVTGETGTGKTLLIGAVRLLLGEPASRDLVGPHETDARVEGRFVDGGDEVVAARRISSSGRSRAYLDGAMVPAKTMRATLSGRVELVAQHDALSLRRSDALLDMIDARLDAAGRGALADYREAWEALGAVRDRREALGGDGRALRRELEMVEFQAGEIEAAGFEPGDDEVVAATVQRLRNASAVLEDLSGAAGGLEQAAAALESVSAALRRAAGLDPALIDTGDRVDALLDQVAALDGDVARAAGELDADPESLERLEQRVALLGDLRRKYGETLDAVLRFGEDARRRADELAAALESAEGLDEALEKATVRVAEAGERLRQERQRAARAVGDAAAVHLRDLGFQDPIVEIAVTARAPGPRGADRAEVRFASDGSLTPGPVSAVASGGELSRLTLALRLAAGVADAPTVAFDEIDAGVGGATALALGEKLAALAGDRQVLCVTHLPQVAAHGDVHYVVERAGAEARVRRVEGEDRVAELARMLAGLPESDRGREHAAELLARAGRR